MGKKQNRLDEIVHYLKENNGASVKDLASLLNVSEMTIRRDLKILDDNGIVNNFYGSAIYNPKNQNDPSLYNLNEATCNHKESKDRIGKFCASLIQNDDTVILDTGSTIEYIARHIDQNLKLKILCITNNVLQYLVRNENFSIIFPGGFLHHNTQMFESDDSISMINKTRANKVFISAAGVHEKLGVTAANLYEIQTKKACIESGAEVYLVCDSSKFNAVKSAYFADLSDFDAIITDSDISKEWEEIINNIGIKLYKI